MATPPPDREGVPFKEEKPQLPPSPVAFSATGGKALSAQSETNVDNLTTTESNGGTGEINAAVKVNGESNGATNGDMNGHTIPPPPITNDSHPSPTTMRPISPTDVNKSTEPIQEDTSLNFDVQIQANGAQVVGDDKKEKIEGKTTTPSQQPIEKSVERNESTEPAKDVLPASLADSIDDPMSLDSPQDAPQDSLKLAREPIEPIDRSTPTLLLRPAHPLTDEVMDDVPDVPMSPTKVSRERESDPEEESSSKRLKIDGSKGGSAEVTRVSSDPLLEPISKMQHKHLTKLLHNIKRKNDARFYREPVDPVKLAIPHYFNIITQPMDLGTMEKKLKGEQYSSSQALIDDFNVMVQNSMTFNGPTHVVALEGGRLRSDFLRQMKTLPGPHEVEAQKAKKVKEKAQAPRREPRTSTGGQTAKAASPQNTTFALGPEGLPVIRRDSSNPDGRPKRSIHPPKRDLPYSTKPKKKKFFWELEFCSEVIAELKKPKNSYIASPFYFPVDPVALNIPTYHSVIKKPMDIQTIESKHKTGQYENAKEFESDVRLMFKNCYRFNIPGDPTYAAGQSLEGLFDMKWKQKEDYLLKHQPRPDLHSDSSDEESDEDGEESNEDDEQLTMLQKQIAEMSRQMELISQKKKKTPPTKKTSKSKTGKKEHKKSTGKKDKKSGKGEKHRYITYHEKQVISNGISSLPDKKMQEALQIIEQNVPSIKAGTQEAEIELDIDELPDNVLALLLAFVKKHGPATEPEEYKHSSTMPTSKTKKNKPMSKFEQEAQINMLESNLSRFQGGGHSPDPVPSVEANESSDDDSDDDSEESEEE
ncbi:transcription regulator BDF1 [Penicillium taxi]|uniref:transcription regulator BDF1 n=1 Tax=Penicillium taxi TaxID=168475 RepID=UPI002545209F|nr:transcription regulator BDF1 [Penicillium taxi]KAJ5908832.1 transcription regulator BDF1 [Penicillium taxi]